VTTWPVSSLIAAAILAMVIGPSASASAVDCSLLAADATMTLGQTVGAGHFLQLEVPEQVNPMIERFLAIIPGGTLAAQ
jgi:pimeloyl-ACP methyl ester carboxylesterase